MTTQPTRRVKTVELEPGMRLAGRTERTVRSVTAETVRGGGEFPDYTVYTVLLEQTMHAANRGRTNQWAEFGPDDLHTIYA